MATVYLARLVGPVGFENVVVIKRMLPHLAEDPRFRDMFADEARTVAKIRHPNVVRTFELIDQDDEIYLVMEYLEGETLQKLTHAMSVDKKRLPRSLACHIVAEAAAGLHAAHELADEDGTQLGIVHRDVSPHNLFVTFDGNVKVIDFGIAKSLDQANQTSTGEIKGKFAYMSPEQVSGSGTSRRTDIFAMGIVLWELLTWRRLFARENQLVTLRAVADEPTPPPSSFDSTIPLALDRICARCLKKDPNDRYQTMAELRRDLLAVLRTEGENDPQSDISRTMQALFEKSIAQRKAMIRASRIEDKGRVDDGKSSRPPPLPPPPLMPTSIELPLEEIPPSSSGVVASNAAHAPTAVIVRGAERARSRVPIYAGVAVAALAIVGAAVAWSRPGPAPSVDVPPAEVPTRLPEVTPELAAVPEPPRPDEPTEVVPPTPSLVHVTIESDPAGALVVVDGIARGNAPVVLDVPLASEPVALELSLAGRRATTARFVPDRDQTLRIDLPRVRGTPPGRTTSGPTEREGFFAFE